MNDLLNNLKKNNMEGHYLEDKKKIFPLLSDLITPGSTIGCGDSVTLEDLKVFDFLRHSNYIFYDKHDPDITRAQKKEIYIKNFSADYFITGTNAVTVDGKLFNIDGNGSRVAPMIYGPGKVIVVIGKNKIVKDVDEAIERTRQTAAPLDAKRLGKKTPCTVLNKCIDCKHQQRICNDFVLITGQFNPDRIKVVIVNEELGY